jgi:RHS repeat-associated protein
LVQFFLAESLRLLTDAAGAVTGRYTYDAFGNLLSSSGATANNYLYQSEQFDAGTGLVYLRARYYNPALGRFTARDPFDGFPASPASEHKYFYAAQDPVNGRDPTGLYDLGEEVEAEAVSDILDTLPTAQTLPAAVESTAVTVGGRVALPLGVRIMITVTLALFVSDEPDPKRIPIIFYGDDLPEHRDHIGDAELGISGGTRDPESELPLPSRLNYKNPGWGRAWLDRVLPTKAGKARDEYPFNAAEQGGPQNYDKNAVSLRYVPLGESNRQGGVMSAFYRTCHISSGDPFIVVPLPSQPMGVKMNTFWVCGSM